METDINNPSDAGGPTKKLLPTDSDCGVDELEEARLLGRGEDYTIRLRDKNTQRDICSATWRVWVGLGVTAARLISVEVTSEAP